MTVLVDFCTVCELMKEIDEYKVIKELEDVSKDIPGLRKKNYSLSAVYFAAAVSMVIYVWFAAGERSELWLNALSFLAGGLLVWSYIKFAEVNGFALVSKYLDAEKIGEMKAAVAEGGEAAPGKQRSVMTVVVNVVLWSLIAYMVVHALNYLGIV